MNKKDLNHKVITISTSKVMYTPDKAHNSQHLILNTYDIERIHSNQKYDLKPDINSKYVKHHVSHDCFLILLE